MTAPAHRSPSESLLKSQPVIVHAVAAWLVGVLLFAAVHYHVVVPGLAPAASAYLVPVVSAVVGSAFTFSLWHFVAPAWKLAQAELKLAGVTVPDFGPEPASVPLKPAPAPLRVGASINVAPAGSWQSFNQDSTGGEPVIPELPAPVDYVAQAAALTPAQ